MRLGTQIDFSIALCVAFYTKAKKKKTERGKNILKKADEVEVLLLESSVLYSSIVLPTMMCSIGLHKSTNITVSHPSIDRIRLYRQPDR